MPNILFKENLISQRIAWVMLYSLVPYSTDNELFKNRQHDNVL